jgi:hypothetical protein
MIALSSPNSGQSRERRQEAAKNEHLTEIGETLAVALMRLTAAKSSRLSADPEDKPVDCEGIGSSHVAVLVEGNGE